MMAKRKERKEYDCLFCKCGRIHIMEKSVYDWMGQDYKNRIVFRVCTHCGASVMTWLDPYEDGFAINSCGVQNDTYDINNSSAKIIFSEGIKVPMKSKTEYADEYFNCRFVSSKTLSCTVDTKQLIKEVNDDDILRSISTYVSDINWDGTKYSSHK